MAPRGQKRGAFEAKTTEVKKTRADPTTVAINDVIKTAGLPTSCREMMLASVAASLETPSDKRHAIQTLVVKMLEELIDAREASHKTKIEQAKSTEQNCEASQATLVSNLAAAESTLVEKTKTLDETRAALAAAKAQVESAKSVLVEKQEIQRTGDATYQATKQTKDAVQTAIEKDMKAIIEGISSCSELVPLLKDITIDESLVIALPGTCAKAPSDRTSFDSMVLTQLENSLKEKLSELSKKVETESPGVAARAADVVGAEKQLADVTTKAEDATNQNASAEQASTEASVAVEEAKAAMSAYEPAMLRAATAHEKAVNALEKFQNSTRAPFELLRDATSALAPSPVKIVEPEVEMKVSVGGA